MQQNASDEPAPGTGGDPLGVPGRDGAGPGIRVVHDEDRHRYAAVEGTAVIGVLAYEDDQHDADDAVGETGDHPAPVPIPSEVGADHAGAAAAPGGRPRAVRDLRSTVVAAERSGEGIGSALVAAAVADARRQGRTLRATCWFARRWIDGHPEAQELLEESR